MKYGKRSFWVWSQVSNSTFEQVQKISVTSILISNRWDILSTLTAGQLVLSYNEQYQNISIMLCQKV